jgi:hypothetical protein
MLASMIVLGIVAAVLVAIGYARGGGQSGFRGIVIGTAAGALSPFFPPIAGVPAQALARGGR